MAGFVDRFKRMWDAPDDEYEDDDNEIEEESYSRESSRESRSRSRSRDYSRDYDDDYSASTRHRSRTRSEYEDDTPSREGRSSRRGSINISAPMQLQVAIFKPDSFGEEIKAIADELVNSHTVVLNLEDTNKDMARRIIDFLSGVTYANKGHIKKVSKSTFLITPNNVNLTGDEIKDELEHSGVYL